MEKRKRKFPTREFHTPMVCFTGSRVEGSLERFAEGGGNLRGEPPCGKAQEGPPPRKRGNRKSVIKKPTREKNEGEDLCS